MPPAPSSRMISYWPRRAPTPGARNGADDGPNGVGVWLGIGVGAFDASGGVDACGGGSTPCRSDRLRAACPSAARCASSLRRQSESSAGASSLPLAGAMRVEPAPGGRGSISPETSLPFSGNIAVRATAARRGARRRVRPASRQRRGASRSLLAPAIARWPPTATESRVPARALLACFAASSSVRAVCPPGTSHS